MALKIKGVSYNKNYFDIFKYVKDVWCPDWEEVENLTLNELWETMQEHATEEQTKRNEGANTYFKVIKDLIAGKKDVDFSTLNLSNHSFHKHTIELEKLNFDKSLNGNLRVWRKIEPSRFGMKEWKRKEISSPISEVFFDNVIDESDFDGEVNNISYEKMKALVIDAVIGALDYIEEHFVRDLFGVSDEHHFLAEISENESSSWDIPMHIDDVFEDDISGGWKVKSK